MSKQKELEKKEISNADHSRDAQYVVEELERYIDEKMERVYMSNKFALTPDEMSRYTHIGENTIREIIKANPYADWLIHIGTKRNKYLIIRTLFEEYLKGGKYF